MMRPIILARVLAGTVCLAGGVAAAGDATTSAKIEAYPTYRAIGIEVSYSGDDNANGSAEMVFRKVGAADWRNGVDLTPDRKRRTWCGSIFPCQEGEAYEISVALRDPDRGPANELHARAQVRKIVDHAAGGRDYFVSPEGDDANPGTREAPLRTIGAAAARVKAGGTVHVGPGVYHESVRLKGLSGRPDSPIVFAAAGQERPVLDASVEFPKDPAAWERHDERIYSVQVDFAPLYVAEDGLRVYRYRSLAELESGRVKGSDQVPPRKWKVPRGWYYDPKSKRLYVKTTAGDNPGTRRIRAVRLARAFRLQNTRHVVIKGFEIRYYGREGIAVWGPCDGNLLIGNLIHNAPNGVTMRGPDARNNLAYRNEVYERGLQDFSWSAVKASNYGRQGFSVHAGRGNSIIENEVHGWFDGIAAVTWQKPDRVDLNRDMDIVGNFVHDGGDDGLEPDGGGVNMRIWGNRITRMLTGISLAPVERGPVYVLRNVVYDSGWTAFKLGVARCTSLGPCYVYHNSCCGTGMAISFPPPPPTGIPFTGKVFQNNAFIVRKTGLGNGRPGNFLDYNCYWSEGKGGPVPMYWLKDKADRGLFQRYPDMAAFTKATGHESHALTADPLFVDGPKGDFRLRPESRLIDRGVPIRGINDDFAGKAPDIGAVESRP